MYFEEQPEPNAEIPSSVQLIITNVINIIEDLLAQITFSVYYDQSESKVVIILYNEVKLPSQQFNKSVISLLNELGGINGIHIDDDFSNEEEPHEFDNVIEINRTVDKDGIFYECSATISFKVN